MPRTRVSWAVEKAISARFRTRSVPNSDSAGASKAEADAARRLIEKVGSSRKLVLDLGCRNGSLIPLLASHFDYVLGVDLTKEMLQMSLEKSRQTGRTDLVLIAGDGLRMLRDGVFDAVFSRDVFIHIPGRTIEQYWEEIRRVLSPGGVLALNVLENRPSLQAAVYWGLRLKPRYGLTRLQGREFPIDWVHPDFGTWDYEQRRIPIGRPYTQAELKRRLEGLGFVQVELSRSGASVWVTAKKPSQPDQPSDT